MASKKLRRQQEQAAQQSAQGENSNVDPSQAEVLEPGVADQEAAPGSGITSQSTEGSDTPAEDDQLEEGLVGDESDGAVVQARGETSTVAHLDELPFIRGENGELPEGVVERDGVFISSRGLGEIIPEPLKDTAERLGDITARDMLDGHPETLVSEEEQAASTAALLAQEPQPEPDAPKAQFDIADAVSITQGEPDALTESAEDEQAAIEEKPVSRASTLLARYAEEETQVQPVIDPNYVGQIGYLSPDHLTEAQLRADLLPKVGKEAAEAWSVDDMRLYLMKGTWPAKTQRQNWVFDARRNHQVKTWTASEMLDFIEGRLRLPPHLDESTVWEEAYARYKVSPSWTIEAFKEYVCNGTVPERTVSGVLVQDRHRDKKQSFHLTFAEIRAALLGEIQTQFTREELMSQYRKRLGIGSGYSDERLLRELPHQPNEVSMDNSVLLAKLDEYKTAITKNPATQTEQTAGECQGMLYKAIRDVIKRDYNEFVEGWNIILDFVNTNYAALFDPYKARRGWSQVALGKQQLQLFEDLLSVIIATREPGNRAKKQMYNLEIVLRHLPNENERQNFFMYYAQ